MGLALCAVVILLLTPTTGSPLPPPATPYNPKPAEGDLVLPMPGGAEMVFRKVAVPGQGFWGDPKRVIQIGDAEGDIFEGLQRVQVSGSFLDDAGDGWMYCLGKYEVTKAQFVSVMGLQRLVEASGDPEDKSLAALSGEGLDKALSRPLAFVSWNTIQSFLHQYNLWLFDPAHPERLEALPKLDGVPGFIRLPTEIEWEYAARGGYPAIRGGRYRDSLPFPREDMVKHAWHLENAKHKVRPVGLRLPNELGLYDMLGNVQELAAGYFRPEIWQGKPGGLVARGGSVSTRAADLRSSYREEVEIYAWNADQQRAQERRSFNTGLRLAIGSNVVISPGHRKGLEEQYVNYRENLRKSMPVGRTLDNPVVQAATQLDGARQNLAAVMAQNQHLKSELSRIQRDIEKAEEKLDFALNESARSTAQDALREATDLGRDIFKLHSLGEQLSKAERLANLSTRYQQLVDTIQQEVGRREEYAGQLLVRYVADIARLGEYGAVYVDQGLATLGEKSLTKRAAVALELLTQHVEAYQEKRRSDPELWRRDFEDRFKQIAD